MTGQTTDQALGAYITSLRTSARLQPAMLARRLSISLAQLEQLERCEHGLFYNEKIRLQTARKVIAHLGGDVSRAADPVEPAAQPLSPPAPRPAESPQSPALSPQPRRGGVLVPAVATLSVLLLGLAWWGQREVGQPTAPALAQSAPTLPAVPAQAEPSPVQAAEPAPAASAAPEAPAPSAPMVAMAAPAASVAASPCGSPQGEAPVVQPPQARKPGDMVYVVSPVEHTFCVTDASGRQQVKHFKAGESLSFYGRPPWQVHSSGLQQIQLYFQGWRVRLPVEAQDRIQLVELR